MYYFLNFNLICLLNYWYKYIIITKLLYEISIPPRKIAFVLFTILVENWSL